MTLILAMVFTSCSKDEIGGTATQQTAGDWYVTADACDASGKVIYEDVYGAGKWHCLTFNTAANDPTKMYLTDQANFWDYYVPVTIDPVSMTFSTTGNGFVDNMSYECKVKIWDGKIVMNGGTQNNGSVADYIEYRISFSDDEYAGEVYDHLLVRGVRYSGLADND